VLALSDLGRLDPTKCHFCVTVAGYNKTLQDGPQGLPGVVVGTRLAPSLVQSVFMVCREAGFASLHQTMVSFRHWAKP
jgi:hypothetical protein